MNDTTISKMAIEKLISRNLKRTYNVMHVGANKLFKNMEITVAQFDLLETILLSEDHALMIQDIASKTVSLQPNITRMVAELESAGLVERSSGSDRRIVIVKLTARGEQLVTECQKPLFDLHVSQYKKLTTEELHLLNELLIKIAHPLPE
ncbi:MAG: MarR family transcriptional regulator [Deltaproteobacteria bacterium]|nr:MarR family transcriptional regulator [Deltaproteobacteria bacterium]